jgi:phage FluMu protein Com
LGAMTTRDRAHLLAIPPEAVSDDMTTFVRVGGGLFMRGGGSTDYFCGRCGRLLLFAMDPHSVTDVWFKCPKCGWLNGMDISLGWAKYVIKELEEHKLSLQRIEQLLDDIKGFEGPVEDYVGRNSDIGPALGWLGRISIGTIVAILSLLYVVYAQQQNLDVAKEGLEVAKQQLTVAQKQVVPAPMSSEEIVQIARELHRLQSEVRIKPPKSSKRPGHGRKR